MRDRTDKVLADLAGTDSKSWESAMERLGEFLGLDASRPDGSAAPDSVWIASKDLAFAWELKSEEGEGEIGARTAQQAAGHVKWAKENCPLADDARVISLLAGDRDRLAEGAEVHARDIYLISLDEVRELSALAVAAISRVRAVGRGPDEAVVRDMVLAEFERDNLLPSLLQTALTRRPAAATAE
jgi:hypothetical protein